MKKSCTLLVLLLCAQLLSARENPQWMRYPAISPDGKTIVFTWQGSLYKVSSKGGEAKPLVKNEWYNFKAVWSRDGKHIAYSSNQFGNFDIFIIPATGGEARRLTWHSTDEYPYDFSEDNQQVIFGAAKMDAVSNRQFPSESLLELYKVPAAGGRVHQVLTTPAEDAKVSKDGRYIIYHDRKGRENPWRKHQVSSIARDIWLYDIQNESHKKLSFFVGEDRSPVFSSNNKDIYYLSEKSGDFNIYEMSLSDTSSQQVTFFKESPVRFLSVASDNTLCFGYDGQIYIKKKNANPVKINIAITEDRLSRNEKTIKVDKAQEMAVSPSGKEVAFVFRGDVFVSSVLEKRVKQITHTPQTEASVSFSPDGKKLLYASERGHKWQVYEAKIVSSNEPDFFSATAIKETPVIANDQENYQPAYSPDGKEIAFIENRNCLKIYNLASGQTRQILDNKQLLSRRDHDQYFQWSPDSKWLLVQYNEQGQGNFEVGLISASGNQKLVNLTQNGYVDEMPKWAMGGKTMIWSTERKGLRNENSNTVQNDIYGMYFDDLAWADVKLNRWDSGMQKDLRTSKEFSLDPEFNNGDHWRNRQIRLTNRSSFVIDALLSKNGKYLYYLDKFEKNYDLWVTDLQTKEDRKLIDLNIKSGEMKWDKEERNIFILADGRIIKIDPLNSKKEVVAIETEMKMDVAREREAMFDHVWRRTAETFYTKGMHGAKWEQMKPYYKKYLKGINNNIDFAEMLNELLGELNVSHTSANFKDERKDGDVTASLGVFYDQDYNGTGVRIKEIMQNGPLDIPSLQIKAGDIIEAVDGKVIESNSDIDAYLNLKSDKNVSLKINDGLHSKEIIVRPVSPSEEEDLVYQRWVQRNQLQTEMQSNGQIGYIHLYRMNDQAYRSTYEDVMGKLANCKAIIVDTRFNRGGDLAPELVTFLSGIKIRENTTDNFLKNNEPSSRWTKPSIVLANEANYSDGHCFAYDYQLLHMGKLVGMPIPGSCTWMTGQGLQDKSLSYSVPTLGVKTMDGSYLENYQTYPDILIMNEYGPVSKGYDQQLEAAIRELQKELK